MITQISSEPLTTGKQFTRTKYHSTTYDRVPARIATPARAQATEMPPTPPASESLTALTLMIMIGAILGIIFGVIQDAGWVGMIMLYIIGGLGGVSVHMARMMAQED